MTIRISAEYSAIHWLNSDLLLFYYSEPNDIQMIKEMKEVMRTNLSIRYTSDEL